MVASNATPLEERLLEVRWMASGDLLCNVSLTPDMRIAEVKRLVFQQAAVPVMEQRLHLWGRELRGHALAPTSGEVLELVVTFDPRVTDLGHFRPAMLFEGLSHGNFTMVRKLASGNHGDVFCYRWRRQGSEECVAVKKLRNERLLQVTNTETDERMVHFEPSARAPHAEDALTEIGILEYLVQQPDQSPHLLRMHGVFAADGFTWLVTEFAEGGELFEVAAAGRVSEARLQRYMFQLFQATSYLHGHFIGHRDISLENILLKDGEIKLMDFGMSVRSHSASSVPLRFYQAVGKESYRAPEMYIPAVAKTRVVAPKGSQPGATVLANVDSGYLCEVRLPPSAVPGRPCVAELWGYAAQPADVFACAVCFFILAWQSPPWRTAMLSDSLFTYIHTRGKGGIRALLKEWKQKPLSPQAMALLADMLMSDPAQRPSAAACLANPWLASMEEVAEKVSPEAGAAVL